MRRQDGHAPGQGRDKTIIDGSVAVGGATLSDRFILAGSGCVLTLKDITLKGGYAVNKGGAVDMDYGTTGTFDNVGFLNNRVYTGGEGYGGAVRVSGTGIFNNCWFESNHAKNGGAAAVENGFGTFNGCTFKTNHASFRGGGTFSHNHNGKTTYNDGNSWISNTCDWKGGGVYQDAGQAEFTGTNLFSSNFAMSGAPQCFGEGPWGTPGTAKYVSTKVPGFTASTGLTCD